MNSSKLDPSQRFLRAIEKAGAPQLVVESFGFYAPHMQNTDKPVVWTKPHLEGGLDIDVPVPEHILRVFPSVPARPLRIAYAVARSETNDDDVTLATRIRELLPEVIGGRRQGKQVFDPLGVRRPRRKTPLPVEKRLTDDQFAAVVLVPESRLTRGERLAILAARDGKRPKNEADKKARLRARRRITELREAGQMPHLVTMLAHHLEQADNNARRLDLIEQVLGINVAEQAAQIAAVAALGVLPGETDEEALDALIEQRD